jgi:hypothetical protein
LQFETDKDLIPMTPALPLDLNSLPEFDPRSIEITDEEILADLWYPHAPAAERDADVISAALTLSLPRAA